MASEKITEEIVLEDLGIKQSEKHREFYLFIQGITDDKHPEIKKILEKAGGKNQEFRGKGKPEYIIRLKNERKVLLVECKADKKNHQSPNLDKPEKFNVDGTLHYAEHFKDKFDTLFLVVSGTERKNCKISFGIWKKGEKTYQFIREEKEVLPWKEYFAIHNEKEQPIEYGKIRKTAQEINEIFRQESWGLGDKQKPFFISACLLAFRNDNFRRDFFKSEEHLKSEHNISDLVSFCKWAIGTEINKLLVEDKETKKNEQVKEERYESLKNNLLGVIAKNQKLTKIKKEKETYFASILRTIRKKVYPHSLESREDIIGHFYHEFLKYSSNSDGKVLGIVLIPSHIAELFCDLALKLLYPKTEESKRKFTEKNKILDICCGTGTFLVSGFSKGASKNNIYGIELDADICDLALTNMILRGDGRTNIYNGSCFNEDRKERDKIEEKIKEIKCNVGFLNPPYSLKKSEKSEGKSEIEFIHHLCNLLEPNSIAIAIVPLSTAIGTKRKEERKKIMEEHTLEAVMEMPPELFSGNASGSHTCVMVWRTGRPHSQQTQIWLANWKDDGFIKLKGKRFDKGNKWLEIKRKWVNSFGEETEKYTSTFQKLGYEDCWLANAWIETDYTKLTKKHFEKAVRDYLAFHISIPEEENE